MHSRHSAGEIVLLPRSSSIFGKHVVTTDLLGVSIKVAPRCKRDGRKIGASSCHGLDMLANGPYQSLCGVSCLDLEQPAKHQVRARTLILMVVDLLLYGNRKIHNQNDMVRPRQSLSPRLVCRLSVPRHSCAWPSLPCLLDATNSHSLQRPSSSSPSLLRLIRSRDGPPLSSSHY